MPSSLPGDLLVAVCSRLFSLAYWYTEGYSTGMQEKRCMHGDRYNKLIFPLDINFDVLPSCRYEQFLSVFLPYYCLPLHA